MAQIVLDQVDKVYPGGVKGIDGLNLYAATDHGLWRLKMG